MLAAGEIERHELLDQRVVAKLPTLPRSNSQQSALSLFSLDSTAGADDVPGLDLYCGPTCRQHDRKAGLDMLKEGEAFFFNLLEHGQEAFALAARVLANALMRCLQTKGSTMRKECAAFLETAPQEAWWDMVGSTGDAITSVQRNEAGQTVMLACSMSLNAGFEGASSEELRAAAKGSFELLCSCFQKGTTNTFLSNTHSQNDYSNNISDSFKILLYYRNLNEPGG